MDKTVVSILDFGAVKNSRQVQTKAIQSAIDHCFKMGGGEVTVPSGEFITGDIRIRSNVTLHLLKDAVLTGSMDPKDYQNINNDEIEPLPAEQNTLKHWHTVEEWDKMGGGFKEHLYTSGSYWNYGIIRAVYAENIAIIGDEGSVIDGRNAFDKDGEEDFRGPHAIDMHFCKNITFDGYTVVRSANWAHAIFQSDNIIFKNLFVFGGHDALHIRKCNNVIMENCHLETGDDCIAGFADKNVIVRNCFISSNCSAFRFGGKDVLIENCEIYSPCRYRARGHFTYAEKQRSLDYTKSSKPPYYSLAFFTYFVTDDLPFEEAQGNILIRNCKITGTNKILHLNLSGNEGWQRGNPPTDITFENLEIIDTRGGFTSYGNSNMEIPFLLSIKNVNFTFAHGCEKEPFIQAANFGKIDIENVNVTNFDGDAFIKVWSDGGEIKTENLTANINEKNFLARQKEKFTCRPI